MNCSNDSVASMLDSQSMSSTLPCGARFARLDATHTLAADAGRRWRASKLLVVGAGVLGSRFALEAALSGAFVELFDPKSARLENLGTQALEPGRPKAESVARRCCEARAGSAVGRVLDIRQAGLGAFDRAHLVVDCSDDAALAYPLTRLCNGLGKALVRLAVDGSGQRELGRVLISDGGRGHACQVCSWSLQDLERGREPTPCPGAAAPGPLPTRAGGALAAAVVGLGLLQCQRLLGGRDSQLALDHELILDLDGSQLIPLALPRSAECLARHERWLFTPLAERSEELTLEQVFGRAEHLLAASSVVVEPFALPLHCELQCACGWAAARIGTRFLPAPACPRCHASTRVREDLVLPRLTRALVAELGIGARSLNSLGLPADQALLATWSAAGHTTWLVTAPLPDAQRAAPTQLLLPLPAMPS